MPAQSGVQLETTTDTGGGQDAGYLANGDRLRFDGVDLGPAGALTLGARLASDSGTPWTRCSSSGARATTSGAWPS